MRFFAIAVTLMGKLDIRTALTQTSTKKQCVGRCRRTAQHNRMNEQQAKCRKLFFFQILSRSSWAVFLHSLQSVAAYVLVENISCTFGCCFTLSWAQFGSWHKGRQGTISLIKMTFYMIYLNVSQLSLNHKCNPLAAVVKHLCVCARERVNVFVCSVWQGRSHNDAIQRETLQRTNVSPEGKRCSTLRIRLCDGTWDSESWL